MLPDQLCEWFVSSVVFLLLQANANRRRFQLQNPHYSDLFGRATPTAAGAVAAAAAAESCPDTARSAASKGDLTAHERSAHSSRSSSTITAAAAATAGSGCN